MTWWHDALGVATTRPSRLVMAENFCQTSVAETVYVVNGVSQTTGYNLTQILIFDNYMLFLIKEWNYCNIREGNWYILPLPFI